MLPVHSFDPTVPIFGLLIGISLGLTGVGAGAILTPALILIYHVRPATAVGTSLVFGVLTKAAGALQHVRQGTADLHVVGRLALGSVPAALVSAGGLLWLSRHGLRGAALDAFSQRAIAGALVLVAIVMTLRFLGRLPSREKTAGTTRLVLLGAGLGLTVAITSVGSGSIAVAALAMLTPLGIATLVGTDMVHALVLSIVTAPFYVISGHADLAFAGWLAVGSIPGVVIGSRLAYRLPEQVTKGAVLLAVWYVAVKLV